MESFPAITVHQPYATLLARGIKDIENRSWETDYRGPVYIHAGAKYTDEPLPQNVWLPDRELFTHKAIIGCAYLEEITKDSGSPWAIPGQFHWRFAHADLWDVPVPWRGQLGLWWPTKFREKS